MIDIPGASSGRRIGVDLASFGEVVGFGQCACTRDECVHRTGAGASHLRGFGPRCSCWVLAAVLVNQPVSRGLSWPGVLPDREP